MNQILPISCEQACQLAQTLITLSDSCGCSVQVSDGDSEDSCKAQGLLEGRHDAVGDRVVDCRAHCDVGVDVVVIGNLHEVNIVLLKLEGIVNINSAEEVRRVNVCAESNIIEVVGSGHGIVYLQS